MVNKRRNRDEGVEATDHPQTHINGESDIIHPSLAPRNREEKNTW